MSAHGIYAITSTSAARPAEPIGTRVDIEVGWIEFDKPIPLYDHSYANTLSLTHRYQVSESGLLLVHVEGMYEGERFGANILEPKRMTGHVVKLR